jgi:peptidoglycan/xylan/chitin deacetylase (PgdA/CDA1 family)
MGNALVLCYHAISNRWSSELSITPESFERQLSLLKERGYRGATFRDAVSSSNGKVMAVTFDDAYRSVLELAEPILTALDCPATVFVPTNFPAMRAPMSWAGIDDWLGGPDEPELMPLSWDELRSLADRGWEVGSHTRSHPRLTQLDDDSLSTELRESREICAAELGGACESLAYPYGDVDNRVIEATARAGYRQAAGLPARWHAEDPLNWPRVGVYHHDPHWRFRLKISRAVQRLRLIAQR